jgi:hypothetical protein
MINGLTKKNGPPMNADKRRSKIKCISAFICVHRRPKLNFLVCFAILLTACTSPQESGVKVIVGARLETGANNPPIEHSVVVIADGKIRAAGTQAEVPVPKGSEITGGLGMTIQPVPGGEPIEAGRPANLILKGAKDRYMRNGKWVE